MSTASLWTTHRKVAYKVCNRFFIPGMEKEDIEQEAMIALWIAARKYDPKRGPFATLAHTLVERRLTDLLRAATKAKRHAVNVRLIEAVAPDTTDRDEAKDLLRRCAKVKLTPRERRGLSDAVNGFRQDKGTDNAAWRARKKLRAAL